VTTALAMFKLNEIQQLQHCFEEEGDLRFPALLSASSLVSLSSLTQPGFINESIFLDLI
jgi:hypothetical protein